MSTQRRHKVIVVGSGFGGLYTTRGLANKDVDVLLIDRNNYHTFTPLLYQVATCSLDPSEIAYPVRGIFRKADNVRFLLGEVTGIDTDEQNVSVKVNGHSIEEHYDTLVLATGTRTNYFGNEQLEQFGFGMKDLSDAVILRNHILTLFEKAAWEQDVNKRRAMTTMVVVGGGPTGLETAGALYELYSFVLQSEYKLCDMETRVVLVEATDNILAPYPEKLQESALKQIRSLGVEVMLGRMVSNVGQDYVEFKDGERIPTFTLVWAAGVRATAPAEMLGVAVQRGGRVPVTSQLEVIGLENVYVVGDLAYLQNPKDGQPYPQLIPVANQQGKLVSKNLLASLKGEEKQGFKYNDRGIMATIGRRRAVAWPFYRVQLTGWFAWVAWLGLHLIWLLGFRNQLSVFVSWVWNYLTYDRSVRIILNMLPNDPSLPDGPTAEDVHQAENHAKAVGD